MGNQHLGRQILEKIKDHGDNTALRYKTDQGWISVSYTEFGKKIQRLACAMEDLVEHPDVIAFYQKRITYHSQALAQYESIKKFRLLPNAFTVETGEITPTLKLKRKNINEKYKEIIDSMYE